MHGEKKRGTKQGGCKGNKDEREKEGVRECIAENLHLYTQGRMSTDITCTVENYDYFTFSSIYGWCKKDVHEPHFLGANV